MGTITQNLEKLVAAKSAIAAAITAKGGTVASGDGFEEFAADIATIPSGASPEPATVVPVPNTTLSIAQFTSWYDGWALETFAFITGAYYMDRASLPQAVSNPYNEGIWIIYNIDVENNVFNMVTYNKNGDFYTTATMDVNTIKSRLSSGKSFWYFIETPST